MVDTIGNQLKSMLAYVISSFPGLECKKRSVLKIGKFLFIFLQCVTCPTCLSCLSCLTCSSRLDTDSMLTSLLTWASGESETKGKAGKESWSNLML